MERVGELHGRVMSEFMNNACYDINEDEVLGCVESTLGRLRVELIEYRLYNIDGEEVRDIRDSRYLRVSCRSGDFDGTHIFTFAILKSGNRYKILYLQSAVELPRH